MRKQNPEDINRTDVMGAVSRAEAIGGGHSQSGIYVLVLLLLVFSFQYMDRQIVSILIQPIKEEFNLSDKDVGLLTGFVFSVPYSLMLFPVGYLVDRTNRRNILAIALAIWSTLTALTGFVRNMFELVVIRAAIAAAESANNPTGLSMLSDYFGRQNRATAIGIYFAGPALATVFTFTLIAYIAEKLGWRSAFFIAGIPGIALAALFYMTVREPIRESALTSSDEKPGVGETLKFILTKRSLVFLLLAMMCTSMSVSSNIAWMAPFLMRVHHFPLTETAAAISIGFGIATAAGQIFGGAIVDRISRRNPTWIGLSCAGFAATAFVFMIAASLTPWPISAVGLIAAWAFPVGLLYGPVGGAIQTLVMPRMRGVTSSIYALLLNLIGFGVGPLIVGALSDVFEPWLHERSLQGALTIIAVFELIAVLLFFMASRFIRTDLDNMGAKT